MKLFEQLGHKQRNIRVDFEADPGHSFKFIKKKICPALTLGYSTHH